MYASGKTHLIPKKDGRMRLIFAPNRNTKRHCRDMLPALHDRQEAACDPDVVHGFYRARSPVTNALQHVGYKFSICFDLSDFFNTVTHDMVKNHVKGLTRWMKAFVAVEGKGQIAMQGLPTSPLLANLAAIPMDAELKALGCRYTRYADDLTFSTNDEADIERLLREVPAIVAKHKFVVNPHKTHVLRASQGRRIITGVAVSADGIHAPRDVKRRLRAARHNGWRRKARGLEEWAKLKVPTDTFRKQVTRKATLLLRRWQRHKWPKCELLQQIDAFADLANTPERRAVLAEVRAMVDALA